MKWITYEEALLRMRGAIEPGRSGECVVLESAVGRVCKDPIHAADDYPHFDNSAVDGFAIGRAEDGRAGSRLTLQTSLSAGSAPYGGLQPGSAARVLTGSVVPAGAYAVVMQEDVAVQGEAIELVADAESGQHIRRAGDDFVSGTPLVLSGEPIGPGAVALLASQGIGELEVLARPRVAVLTTGDELVPLRDAPPPGSLRDSNGPMLAALVRSTFGVLGRVEHVRDDRSDTGEALARLAGTHDILICAGGASVGDRDHIPSLVAALGEIVFHGVAIRPGKPVLMGRIGRTPVFGLPGNPASAFVTFELFVREAIAMAAGCAAPAPLWIQAPIDTQAGPAHRDDFARCRWIGPVEQRWVQPVGAQGSFGLRSLAAAECLARIPAGAPCKPGTIVSVLCLP